MSETEDRNTMFAKYRDELLKRQLSNSENFDKAILSLSSAGLGFSLAFIKDVIPLSQAVYTSLLIASWFMFACAIVFTLVSFYLSQKGIDKQLYNAEQYYLEDKDEYLTKINWPAKLTTYCNNIAGLIFIIAIFLTVIFVSNNLLGGDIMEGKNKQNMKLEEGAEIPKMKKVIGDKLKKGAPIPTMQQKPKPNNQSQSDGNQGGSQGSNKSSE